MLVNLHVKNLALIEEAEVDFGKGLNILTGETGAGKSLIIGSVNLALGAKALKDLVRENADSALVELVFDVHGKSQLAGLKELGIEHLEDGQVIMQRRIKDGRSTARINGETVTAAALKAASELLIDIHGQHEHQSLLYKKNHLLILDNFASKELEPVLSEMKKEYETYLSCKREMSESMTDEETRARELSLLEYEINEIENAHLLQGEDEQLETSFLRMQNGKHILEVMSEAYRDTGYESVNGAGENVGRALHEMKSLSGIDAEFDGLLSQLMDIDGLLNDFNRGASDYMSRLEFSEEDYRETEARLNTWNHIKSKYGDSYEKIMAYLQEKQDKLEKYNDYDVYLEELKKKLEMAQKKLTTLSEKATKIRLNYAENLSKSLQTALVDLNFTDARFNIEVRKMEEHFSSHGWDEVEFMFSANVGEKLRPLTEVASGGELSRVMLALKTVLASRDEIDTLIFDEIDTGISGRTAQKVAEKLSELAGKHQVICITHLPQIAAQADHHFLIDKGNENGVTSTQIRELKDAEMIEELSRILGGAEITDTVRENAREMKELAKKKQV